MKINRKSTIKSIIFLCILLLICVFALAIVIKSNEMNVTIPDIIPPQQTVFIDPNPPEQTCVFQPYHDPNEFHRIYYNDRAEFIGNRS